MHGVMCHGLEASTPIHRLLAVAEGVSSVALSPRLAVAANKKSRDIE